MYATLAASSTFTGSERGKDFQNVKKLNKMHNKVIPLFIRF
jgi:hypothetical protein